MRCCATFRIFGTLLGENPASFARRLFSIKASTASELIRCADDVIHQPFKDSDDTVDRLCVVLSRSSVDCRIQFLRHLANTHSIKFDTLKSITDRFSSGSVGDEIAAAKRISDAGLPSYKYLFEKLARNGDGIRLLVDLRTVLIGKILEKGNNSELNLTTAETDHLKFMSGVLRELFLLWFSPALLQLQRLSWDSTPASLLEAVARSQAVHPVRNWIDLKRRLHKADRRCFVFTHPALSSSDPIIILYVALMQSIPDSMRQILRISENIPDAIEGDDQKHNAAIFYSIVSQHKGLNGIDLGHSLIRRVMGVLRSESPELSEFSTLSPVPGFLNWLGKNIDKLQPSTPKDSSALSLLQNRQTISSLPDYIWHKTRSNNSNEGDLAVLKSSLLRLAAKYLCVEKHRGFALDPVAHFHLRNGAEIWRINWCGDLSARGLSQSASIMVNYRYWPEKLDKNAHAYAVDRKMALSSEVEKLLDHP